MFLMGFVRFTHQWLQGGHIKTLNNFDMKIFFNGKICTFHTNTNKVHNVFSHSQHLQGKKTTGSG